MGAYAIGNHDQEDNLRRASAGALQYTPAERELLGRVQDRANNERLFGLKYEVMQNGLLSLAYYNGHQHTYWDNRTHRLLQAPIRSGQHRVVDNKIMPACIHAMSMLQSQLSFTCRPEAADHKSRAKARLSERALKQQYRKNRWSRKLRTMNEWRVNTGTAFVRPFFNPNIGPEIEFFMDPNTGLVIPNEMLKPQDMEMLRREGMSKKVREGDVDLSVHSLFDVYVPDTTLDTDDMQWYVLTYRKSLGWVRQHYPARGAHVASETFTAWERNSFEARILAMSAGSWAATRGGSVAGGLNYDDDQSTVLKIYIEQPTPENPMGSFAAVASDVLLQTGPAPSAVFGLPGSDLFKFDMLARPGSFWKMGLPEPMIPPQRELNATRGQQSELRSQLARPRVYAPYGHQMMKSAWVTGSNVEIIEFKDDAAGKIQFDPARNIPPTMFANADAAIQSMRDLSAQQEATQGVNPSGSRSGSMITQLQENARNFYKPIFDSDSEVFSQLWESTLMMIQQTWRSQRWVEETAGTEIIYEGWITGEDMAKRPSIIVDPDSLYPESRAAKQAFASEVMQYGVNLEAMPAMLRSSVLDGLQIGDDTRIREIYMQDVRRCEAMIDRIIDKDVDIAVRPGIDDHGAYVQVIMNFMKTRQWEGLEPIQQWRVQKFYQAHLISLVQGMQAQASAEGGAQAPAGQSTPQAEPQPQAATA